MRKRIITFLFTSLLIMLLAIGSNAQELLTLPEALQLALENNGVLQSSQVDLDKANNELDMAYLNLLPQVNLQSTYTRLNEGVPTATGEYLAFPTGETFELPIPGMGSIEIPVFAAAPEMEEGSPNMFNTQLSIQQPVFVGGKMKLGIEMAEDGVELAEIQSMKQIADTLYQVIQTYYNLLQAKEMVQIQEKSLELLNEHQRIVQINYDAGLVLETDLLQIQIEKSKAKQQLKSAQNGLYLAKKQLAQTLGLDDARFTLRQPEKMPLIPGNLELQYQTALEKRPELKTLEVNQAMLEKNLLLEERSFWPNVMLMGNYSWKGSELSFKDGSWNISLSASMQLFDGGISKKKQKGVKLQMEQLSDSKENLADLIELEIEEALLKIEEAQSSLELQELNLESARKNLEMVNASYAAGMATNVEVLTAQNLLQQTEMGKLQAQIQYQLSVYKLIYKSGTLFEYCEEVIQSEK